MIAIIWIILGWLAGWRILRPACGDSGQLLLSIAGRNGRAILASSPWPALLFRLAASLWAGLLPMAWLTYGLAALADGWLPVSCHPLLPANIVMLLGVATWLAWPAVSRLIQRNRLDLAQSDAAGGRPVFSLRWGTFARMLQQRDSRYYLMALAFWLILAVIVMAGTFSRSGSLLKAGYSVFSDFAPHTALASSFSQGRNWPTEYPHFANDGIAYHFMFYFMCGNLNFLGLSLDIAINLPSILGLLSSCLLLGVLAVVLTGRRATFFLAPTLLFFRSSLAFFTYLGSLFSQYGTAPAAWPQLVRSILRQSVFIGNTPHDDWGLWGINVYANQRHLLPALSLALVILFLFLPDLQDGLRRRPSLRQFFFGREYWRLTRVKNLSGGDDGADSAGLAGSASKTGIADGYGSRRLATALLLGVLMPYFHGSVLVSLLLVLSVIAVFSTRRPAFILFGVAALLAALAQSQIFAGSAGKVVQPHWLFGFLVPDPSLPAIMLYLLEMSGFLLPLLAITFWLPGRRRKILIAAFCLPLVFAFTFSLTPDVTVNHKYIIICFALANIYIADLLARLWDRRRAKRPALAALRRTAAILLSAVLVCTGVQELIILRNISRNTVAIDLASPLAAWIKANTSPDAVFVCAPYHYNSFFLSGRSAWLGHSYYAWSAGHDTASRLTLEQWLLAGGGDDIEAVQDLVESAGLDYLIIDDTLRQHPEFTLAEGFFDQYYPIVADFPQLDNIKVYALTRDDQGLPAGP